MSDDPRSIGKAYQAFRLEEARVTAITPRTDDAQRAYSLNEASQARWAASTPIKEWGESRSSFLDHAREHLANSRELGQRSGQSGFATMDRKASEPAKPTMEQQIRARIAARHQQQSRKIEGHELRLSR